MAAFTNQFEHTEPFQNSPVFEYYGWLVQIARELETLLEASDQQRLTAIARQIECVISKAVLERKFTATGPMQRVASSAQYKNAKPEELRAIYGDLNLFNEVHDSHRWDIEVVSSEKWERYGVFSLWKLADAIWEDRTLHSADGVFGMSDMTLRIPDKNLVVAYIVEAMRSLQTAQSILLEQRLVSDRNRLNVQKRYADSFEKKAEALRLADVRPHRSLQKAAEYVADRLTKDDDANELFSVETIKRWLRDANWKPLHKREITPT